jgi:hypothetical protein
MAYPNQANIPKGSHSGTCDILASDDRGTGSGWQQGTQTQTILAVENKPGQNAIDLCFVELTWLRFFHRQSLLMVAFTISSAPNPEGALSTRRANLHCGLMASSSGLMSVCIGNPFCQTACWLLACHKMPYHCEKGIPAQGFHNMRRWAHA